MAYGELLEAGKTVKNFGFLIFDFRLNRKSKIAVYALCFLLCSMPFAYTVTAAGEEQIHAYAGTVRDTVRGEDWESRYYLIEGVHYLLNEGDRDMAEELFRKAIFSSSFSSLSKEAEDEKVREGFNPVAEAFYFLGKIHYEKAILDIGARATEKQESSLENIAWAKKYLRKAEEYGIVYDQLHPPLLGEINRGYPEIKAPIPEPGREEAKVIIEVNGGSYQINVVRVDQQADVTEAKFLTNKEFDLECGARYKMRPDVQGGYRSIYRALAVLGTGLVIWLARG